MSDDTKKQQDQHIDTNISERPLDPNRNASDLMGDPSGMTGWTIGNGPDTSAEPTEKQPSTENLPGGIIADEKSHQPSGLSKESVSDQVYNENAWKGMSQTKAVQSNDIAEESESFSSVSDMIRNVQEDDTPDTYNPDTLRKASAGDDSPGSNNINTETAPYSHPENVGEQEVSGSETDPNSDSDSLANAQAVGTQLDENSENPEELDIARDIDEAEEHIRSH